MSWKSIVITGLLCVVASPVLAAPNLTVDLVRGAGNLPLLDASGNWQWRVSVVPDSALFVNSGAGGTPPNTLGGSMAIEIGLTFTGAPVLSAAVNTTNFDKENFGNSPFAFGESPADGLTISGNQIFAALGSTFFTDNAPKEVFTVKTSGPSTVGPNLTTGVSWLGDYTGKARISQASTNFDTFSGSLNKAVLGGDANLNGTVNSSDLLIVLNNINQTGKTWSTGDFNKTGVPNSSDVLILLNNINQSVPAPGGGSFAGANVPEPASVCLLLMGACVALGLRRSRS